MNKPTPHPPYIASRIRFVFCIWRALCRAIKVFVLKSAEYCRGAAYIKCKVCLMANVWRAFLLFVGERVDDYDDDVGV